MISPSLHTCHLKYVGWILSQEVIKALYTSCLLPHADGIRKGYSSISASLDSRNGLRGNLAIPILPEDIRPVQSIRD